MRQPIQVCELPEEINKSLQHDIYNRINNQLNHDK